MGSVNVSASGWTDGRWIRTLEEASAFEFYALRLIPCTLPLPPLTECMQLLAAKSQSFEKKKKKRTESYTKNIQRQLLMIDYTVIQVLRPDFH